MCVSIRNLSHAQRSLVALTEEQKMAPSVDSLLLIMKYVVIFKSIIYVIIAYSVRLSA